MIGYGDSITFRPDSWCRQLPDCTPSAVPGEQTWDGVARLLETIDQIPPQSRVVLAWGVNDVRDSWSVTDTLEPLREAVMALQAHGHYPEIWVPTPQYLPDMTWHPVANPRVELELRPMLYDMASEYDIPIHDQWDAFLVHPNTAALYADQIHPNVMGQAVLAQTVPEPAAHLATAVALMAVALVARTRGYLQR